MYPYHYNVSLRIWHPTLTPADISETLEMSPARSWEAGGQRSTPKGNLLEGKNKETYWCAPTHKEKHLFSKTALLEQSIEKLVHNLRKHRSFFQKIRETGGRIEFFIGLYATQNSGCVFSSSLLKLIAELEIDLAFDIYPEDQPGRQN